MSELSEILLDNLGIFSYICCYRENRIIDMTKEIKIRRIESIGKTTIGKCLVDGKVFCYTLEDKVRPKGVKVYGETAIPEGNNYQALITYSNKYKRDMILLTNSPDYESVTDGFNVWRGIRIHGGNTHEDTHGCVLVAFNRPNKTTIQGRADLILFDIVKKWKEEGYKVIINIENKMK